MDDDTYISETYFSVIKGLLEKVNMIGADAFSGRIMTIENPLKPLSRYQGAENKSVTLHNIDTVLSSALVIRKSMFSLVGNFVEDFGVGARWGGSEESDLLARILKNKSSVEYFASLEVFHPMSNFDVMSYKDIFKKTYTYGLGRGAFIRKHKFLPKSFIFNASLMPLGVFFVSLLLLRIKDYTRYMSSVLGHVNGFKKYKALDG